MYQELFLELPIAHETNPGNNGGIDPSGTGGGPFPKERTAHQYGFLATKPKQGPALRVSSLSDLRMTVLADAQPQHGRIAFYAGNGPQHVPLFLAPLKVEAVAGAGQTFKIPDAVVQLVSASSLFVEGNTLGVELAGPGTTMRFSLSSILK